MVTGGYAQAVGAYVLSTVGALLVARVIWELAFSPLRKFPGPLPSRFTNLWRMRTVLLGNADAHHREWHRRYGSAVRVGPDAVMLNDPNLIKTVYTVKNAWKKTNMYRPNDVVGPDGTRHPNLFNTQDDEWYDRYKRPVGGFFSLSKVLEMEHHVDESIEKYLDKLEKTFLSEKDVSDTIMMDEWLAFFAWDSNMKITYGRHYGFIEQGQDVSGLIKTSKSGVKYFGILAQMSWLDDWLDKNPIWRIGPGFLVDALKFTIRVVGEYQKQLADVAKGSGTAPPAGHLLERFVKTKSTHPAIVDDNQVINYTLLSVGGGGDTTAGALRAIVYYLAKNPSTYARLSAEIDAAKLPVPVSWKAATALPYLDAVIRESMRLSPAVSLMLERYVPDGGFDLPDGRFLPAGTRVGMNPAVTNRSTEIFGPDTDSFVPERWLRRDGESEDEFTTRSKRMNDIFDFTFGAGKRICIGRNIAKLEIYKLLPSLYTLYDLKLVDAAHEWKYENYFFIYQSDMPMILSRRK